MRYTQMRLLVPVVCLSIVGGMTLAAGEANAKRGFGRGSSTIVTPRVSTTNRGTQPTATAATVVPTSVTTDQRVDQDAAHAAAMERAKRKLDAERSEPVTASQVSLPSDGAGALQCVAGCYK